MGFLLIDEVEVPEIDDRIKKIGSNEDGAHLPDSISQKDQPSPPRLKYQKATGMTLSFLLSEAIH